MRCFFALPVAGEAAAALSQALAEWRRREPGIRWEAPEALHVTVQFLGTWPDARLSDLAAAIANWPFQPFPLSLSGFGAFPSLHRPRVAWAGMEASPQLHALADELARRLAPLGLEREARPFTPHISLARLRPGQRLQPGARPLSGGWLVRELCLYETVAGAPPAERYQPRLRVTPAACN